MVPTKLKNGEHTLGVNIVSNNSMDCSQLASSNTKETNILFHTHTTSVVNRWHLKLYLSLYFIDNFYCEWLTFETMFVTVFYTQLVVWWADIRDTVLSLYFYTQLLLWTAHIWDYFCHSILYYTIHQGAINGQSMAGKKNITKRIQFCRNVCPPMCIFNAMVNLPSFSFLFCGAIFHIEPYNGWPRKDQTCLMPFVVPFLSHAYVMSGGYASLDPPCLYFMWSNNLLSLFVFFFFFLRCLLNL